MEDEDREELLWRRVAEKVTEAVDKQMRTRYFWAILVFAIASWFGGASLITSVVQLRVSDKMEPVQEAGAKAKALEDLVSSKLIETEKSATKIIGSMKELNERLDTSNCRGM